MNLSTPRTLPRRLRIAPVALALAVGGSAAGGACAASRQSTPPTAPASRGTTIEIAVQGPSIVPNLLGVAPVRTVAVYLPPSYGQGTRRYPVVYVLHGIFDSPRTWTQPWGPPHPPHPGYATIQQLMDAGIARGTLREMIVVMPDAEKTCHYTDGPVKGGWASFIAKDLVSHIDGAFRTIAAPAGRGILGHSMGGHGALKLAMLHPGTFSAVYAMNPSMLGFGGDVSAENPSLRDLATLRTREDVQRANFYVQAMVGIGQCFAPDPAAPLLTNLPFGDDAAGTGRAAAAREQWVANMPIHMAPRHAAALRALAGLRFDSAFEEEFTHIPITTRAFSAVLDSLGVSHTFEMYNGDHRNRLWGQHGRLYTAALPFFSSLLGEPATVSATTTDAPDRAAAQEALWAAARRGDVQAAERALTAGADINALDTLSGEGGASGRRALNFAALHNRRDMIRWLVSRGADINQPNKTGFTPLHHAAESGALPAVQALLALGADPNVRLPSGSTPLRVAQQRGHQAVVQVLEPVTRR